MHDFPRTIFAKSWRAASSAISSKSSAGAVGAEVTCAPPCILPQGRSVENVRGRVGMTLPPAAAVAVAEVARAIVA